MFWLPFPKDKFRLAGKKPPSGDDGFSRATMKPVFRDEHPALPEVRKLSSGLSHKFSIFKNLRRNFTRRF
jgi:hypothetical protein